MLFTTPLLLALGIATNAFSASALVITARAGDGVRVKGPKDLSSWRNIMTEAQLKAVSGGGGPIAIQLDAPGATPNAPRDQAHCYIDNPWRDGKEVLEFGTNREGRITINRCGEWPSKVWAKCWYNDQGTRFAGQSVACL